MTIFHPHDRRTTSMPGCSMFSATLHICNFTAVTANCLTQETLRGWCNIHHGWCSFPQHQETWKVSDKAIAKPSLIHIHGHGCPVCTDWNFWETSKHWKPYRARQVKGNSPETPLAAVRKQLQNQRNTNKLLKAIWTNLPLKARLSPTINQISCGFIWLNLENLQGPRFHNSSKKHIPVLPTEEVLLMSSFSFSRWKLWPLPSDLLWNVPISQ